MLRCINKQLSKQELFQVEKHLLDCEFCNDAFEGIQLTTNSSILFAIDNKIDLRTKNVAKKPNLLRNLMLAASVVIIAIGAFFVVKNFNDKLLQDELAIAEYSSLKKVQVMPEKFITKNASTRQITEIKDSFGDEEKELSNNIGEAAVVTVLTDEIFVPVEEERVVQSAVKNEKEIAYDEIEEDEMADGDFSESLIPIQQAVNSDISITDKSGSVTENVPMEHQEMVGVVQSKSEEKRLRKGQKKKSMKIAGVANVADNTYDIYTYKVYDYAVAYQNEYDFDKSMQQEVMNASFETKNDKEDAQTELENNTIEITYKKTLETAIKALKNKNYPIAIAQFDAILKEHPKDVNALFYSGIAMYKLNQFNFAKSKFDMVLLNKQSTFNQEASWYLAKSNVELNEIYEAKIIVQEIIDEDGFYKKQAIKLLEELTKF